MMLKGAVKPDSGRRGGGGERKKERRRREGATVSSPR